MLKIYLSKVLVISKTIDTVRLHPFCKDSLVEFLNFLVVMALGVTEMSC